MNQHKLEPIVLLLTLLVVFFTVALFVAEYRFRDDAVFFQALVGMATGVLGALLGIITGKRSADAIEAKKNTATADATIGTGPTDVH